LDIAVLAVALFFALSGWRRGAVASAMSFLGVLLGAVAGILIAPHLLTHLSPGRTRVLAGIGLIVALVIVGEMAGMVLGSAARGVMRSPAARVVDSTTGAGLQAVGVLIAAWLLAVPLSSSSQPSIAGAVSGSHVLGQVNALAPQWLRSMPRELAGLLNTSGFPQVIGPFSHVPVAPVDPPDTTALHGPVPIALHISILKIHGIAPSCQRALEGSGFVVAPGRIMTNAHVVAGTTSVTVDTARGTLPAQVVRFDPSVDVAVLAVPGLDAPVLSWNQQPGESGENAIVLGYPNGGQYTASAARIRERFVLSALNIYGTQTVERQVYTVRGEVRPGNSGGPLVDDKGRVLGVVFGVQRDDPDTGYALTLDDVKAELATAPNAQTPADTGPCVLG
jgi:S1-C subfamily serine protease